MRNPAAIFALVLLSACLSVPKSVSNVVSKTVVIGPQTVTCQGIIEQQCMIVDGKYFYDTIQGFTHKPGVQSTLEIERRQACGADGLPECTQDAGLYTYVLKRVVAEYPA